MDGVFQGLEYKDDFKQKYVVQEDLWVAAGDSVSAFRGANDAIGTSVLKFETEDTLLKVLSDLDSWLKINIL